MVKPHGGKKGEGQSPTTKSRAGKRVRNDERGYKLSFSVRRKARNSYPEKERIKAILGAV